MATSLTRRDSFAPDIFNSYRNSDDFFNRLFAPAWERWMTSSSSNLDWIPAVESYIDQNKYHVRMTVPGVKPSDVNVQVHNNELVISGERKQEQTPSDERTFQREIVYGSFERVLPLPDGVQGEKIEASYANGVLEITAPLSEKTLPRKIDVKSAETGRKLAA
jgi:HSP20 family protein